MRAPRYRFPNEVRSTTREIATRMVRDGEAARTPEQLDAWIAERPEVEQSLRRGGYGTAFTSHDLFPLLQVFIAQAAPEPGGGAPGRSRRRGWVVALVLVLALLSVAVAMGLLR